MVTLYITPKILFQYVNPILLNFHMRVGDSLVPLARGQCNGPVTTEKDRYHVLDTMHAMLPSACYLF